MFQDIRAKFSLHDGSTIDPRGESHCDSITTGLAYFAECQRHSAKAGKHSAKKSPSVALGEAHTAFLLPAKTAMPSAFSRALGKFLPCATPHSAKKMKRDGRTANGTDGTGWERNFAECWTRGTRQRSKVRRVPDIQHSAKFRSSPSATLLALGEVWIFAECHTSGTRRSFKLRRVPR